MATPPFYIFIIFISQAIRIEDSEEFYQKKYCFIEDRIDDTWTIEEGMNSDKELLISVNGNVIHADRLRYRLMDDCYTINVLTQFSTTKKNPKTENIEKPNADTNPKIRPIIVFSSLFLLCLYL